jgi:hypothetical protein
MTKKDKKFLAALIIAQTGIFITAISLSSVYWYKSVTNLMKLNNLQELSAWVNGEHNKIESENKITDLKKNYEKKGIEVEEN